MQDHIRGQNTMAGRCQEATTQLGTTGDQFDLRDPRYTLQEIIYATPGIGKLINETSFERIAV